MLRYVWEQLLNAFSLSYSMYNPFIATLQRVPKTVQLASIFKNDPDLEDLSQFLQLSQDDTRSAIFRQVTHVTPCTYHNLVYKN